MATLLLELFSEEIPSRMQRGAAEQLQRLITTGLEKNQIAIEGFKTFVSPRHLAIQCFGLPLVQPDVKEERKGPKVGAPEQAMKGFLGATGLTVEQCEQRDGYYFATIERKGQPTADVVKKIIEESLAAFSWPKSMRWGNRPLNWVRPLHRIACLLGDKVIPVQFAHLTAHNTTEGHRFMAPDALSLAKADDYEPVLKSAKVIVDYAARREQIRTEIAALASAANLTVVPDEALLDEVTGLVEWPVPLLCRFDAKFLSLPPEVLISEMKNHQRYFALNDASGKLSDQFITVANMVTKDGGQQVKDGNARVVRARLADGEFYWEQDQKTSLEQWGAKLADVVFHAKVGMMNEKVQRIEALAVNIANAVGFADVASVKRTAILCKADLTSGMVGEFPELQGIMGRYYATAQGETQAIADAIRDHYKPVGANDSVPETKLAAIIAIADKLDSIISLFVAGEKPTGSKDPLALRRAALGILRIIFEHKFELNLHSIVYTSSLEFLSFMTLFLQNNAIKSSLLEAAKDLSTPENKARLMVAAEGPEELPEAEDHFAKRATKDVIEFLHDRLKNLLRDEGIRHDIIDAAAFTGTAFVPVAIANHARNLNAWIVTPQGATTTAAIKRTQNILAAEEKKAKQSYSYAVEKLNALTQPTEQDLRSILGALNAQKPEDLNAIATPINAFFDAVLVTEPEFRDARLSLLAGVVDATRTIADFSKIEG